ncbi:uncharacterized protein IUM83_14272 [Phytophthora cinnamomi]|uniref:uncharacterized protein n=1 Tax=Phytophthora cinnamomi TaxID=4785 RepID=UPI00355A7DF4|nr:hypothetical protein IUM83_14272 [Phytophthora cinnamomi]
MPMRCASVLTAVAYTPFCEPSTRPFTQRTMVLAYCNDSSMCERELTPTAWWWCCAMDSWRCSSTSCAVALMATGSCTRLRQAATRETARCCAYGSLLKRPTCTSCHSAQSSHGTAFRRPLMAPG